ncbi:MAG: hypothetical protein IKA79_01450 [Lentisphaeria bacterium]|nr:hypothetical protein [Lentisphaeria bacterium]
MKIFSFLAGAAALVLTAGCAFSEFKTTSAPVTDPRISFIENGGFSLKPLNVVTKIDDEGCMNADVTFELGGSPFCTWLFKGAPMQTLHYRFDWVDRKGHTFKGKIRKVEILPGNILTVDSIAPSEKYKDFRFEVSFCNNSCESVKKCENKKCVKAPVKCTKTVKKAEVKKAPAKTVKKAEVKKAPAKTVKKAEVKKAPAKTVKKAEVKKAPAKTVKKAEVKKTPAAAVKKAEVKKAPAKTVKKVEPKKAPAKTVKKVEPKKAPATAVKKAEVKKTPATAVKKAEVKKVPTSSAAAVKADGKLAEAMD